MVLAWHTNVAPRWLGSQQHYRGATPKHFINVVHHPLIKNFRDGLYDHLALTERYEFAEDATSAPSSCGKPQMSAAPGGSSRPNIIRTSDKRSLRVESQAAQSNTSRAAGWPRGASGIGATPTR